MKRSKDGNFSVAITLKPGEHAFRYVPDGERWENDRNADEYRPNPFGGEDSIIKA
jgi:hypothetical protein